MESGISVVIPCLNEEASIADAVTAAQAGIAKLACQGEVIVVDNGSEDRSASLAAAAGARVIRESKRGYGMALRKGFAAARYPVMVMGDGDMTYDFRCIDTLARPILDGTADLVIGNRMDNIHPGAMPALHRHVGTPVLSFLLRILFHHRGVRDAQCGMRVIRKDAYLKLGCVTTGMEFASEMIIKAIYNRLRIAERDIEYFPRVGESKLRTFRDGWRHLRFMLLHSPTTVMIFPGMVFWLLSLGLSIPLAARAVVIGQRMFDIHFLLALGAINIASIQVVTLGLLAKAYAHLSGLRQDPFIAWLYKRLSFEVAAAVAGTMITLGVLVGGHVFLKWSSQGFAGLNAARPFFFAVLCIVNGVQIGASSYLFSIMALPRHADHLPPEVEDTGISDLG
jgi:glycosyltransferase involved in cell wall biosynthesis